MSKVITFSRYFPSYHPRAGEPTYFVEKIWKGIYEERDDALYSHECSGIWSVYKEIHHTIEAKHHTIRAGHRFKAGDWFSPRVWSGKPYRSKQIIIAPNIQVRKVWNFTVRQFKEPYFIEIRLDGKLLFEMHNNIAFLAGKETLEKIATNDGLELEDFEDWFGLQSSSKCFYGQIICWNENIDY